MHYYKSILETMVEHYGEFTSVLIRKGRNDNELCLVTEEAKGMGQDTKVVETNRRYINKWHDGSAEGIKKANQDIMNIQKTIGFESVVSFCLLNKTDIKVVAAWSTHTGVNVSCEYILKGESWISPSPPLAGVDIWKVIIMSDCAKINKAVNSAGLYQGAKLAQS